MSKRGDVEFLLDIQEATKRIQQYCESSNYEAFSQDIKTQDAIIRNFEIIGEAAKSISKDLKEQHTDIAWGDLAKLRDKLIHHYFGVNIDIVWGIVNDTLPDLETQLELILKQIQ